MNYAPRPPHTMSSWVKCGFASLMVNVVMYDLHGLYLTYSLPFTPGGTIFIQGIEYKNGTTWGAIVKCLQLDCSHVTSK